MFSVRLIVSTSARFELLLTGLNEAADPGPYLRWLMLLTHRLRKRAAAELSCSWLPATCSRLMDLVATCPCLILSSWLGEILLWWPSSCVHALWSQLLVPGAPQASWYREASCLYPSCRGGRFRSILIGLLRWLNCYGLMVGWNAIVLCV